MSRGPSLRCYSVYVQYVFSSNIKGDSLITRTVTDILTDSKLKIRAHRQIVGKPLDEILKPDADGDM